MKEVRDPVVVFRNVIKDYIHFHHITTSLKELILSLPVMRRRFREARFRALHGISFVIYRGEIVGITGHNGAGKSTLLSLVCGITRPTSGTVRVRGRVVALLELGTGFEPDLTGLENIYLNGILLGMTRREIRKKLDEIIAFSELGNFIHEPVRTYSSGMKARLAFSIAVHADADILLIDEVLAVGDASFRKKCIHRLKELNEKYQVTMLFVSHERELLQQICHRLFFLERGRLVQIQNLKPQPVE